MHADGSGRQKVSPSHIFDLLNVSPNGKWALVQAGGGGEENPAAVTAFPVEGGDPVRLCLNLCVPGWDVQGESMYMQFFVATDQNTYVLRLRQAGGLAELPTKVALDGEILKKMKPVAVIPHLVDSAVSTSTLRLHGEQHADETYIVSRCNERTRAMRSAGSLRTRRIARNPAKFPSLRF